MTMWLAIKLIIAGMVLVGTLYGLHRLALYLEQAGYMYYSKDRFAAGAARGFMGMQEVLEPTAKHVIEAQDDAPLKALERANWNKWLAELESALGRNPQDREAIRRILAEAERNFLDSQQLYSAACNRIRAEDPEKGETLPDYPA